MKGRKGVSWREGEMGGTKTDKKGKVVEMREQLGRERREEDTKNAVTIS